MNNRILENTYELIDEIKSNDIYIRLLELKVIIDKDDELNKLIQDFNKVKLKYEEVTKYGKYHPDLKKVQLELAKTKELLYSNEKIKEYKDLEKKLQSLLDEISSEIAQTVSSKIKHPNEIGLINKH